MILSDKMKQGLNNSQVEIVKKALSEDEAGHHDKAIELFCEIVNQKAKSLYVFGMLGVLYFYKNEYEKAIEYFQESLQLYPEQAHVIFLKAQAEEKLRMTKEAISDFKLYIELSNKHNKKNEQDMNYAFISLGEMYYDKQKYKQSIKYLTKAIDIVPDNANVFFLRAQAKEKLYLLKSACIDYSACLKLQPDDFEAWANIGFIYDFWKLYDDAVYYYEKSLEVKYDESVQNRLMEAKRKQGEEDRGFE